MEESEFVDNDLKQTLKQPLNTNFNYNDEDKIKNKFYQILISAFTLIVLFVALSLSLAYYTSEHENLNDKTILRPLIDQRNYKAFLLANDMKVMLISDVEAKNAGASLSIEVGSMSNPYNLQGLNHLLEHMISQGSSKYPNPNEFKNILNINGGKYNAYTDLEESNHHFIVPTNEFENALDVFSNFFLEPLMDKDSLDQEITSIDNEFQLTLNNIDWQTFYFLTQQIANQYHPYSYFSIGNIESLKNIPQKNHLDIHQEMIQFYKKYYSANLMTLVLISSHPIELLEEWVKNKFTLIPNVQLERPKFIHYPKPFQRDNNAIIAKLRGFSNQYRIQLMFPIEEILSKFREKPIDYISQLLGHEGPNTLISQLKNQGFISHLECGIFDQRTEFTIFMISIKATKIGFQNYNKIIQTVFEYLKLIESQGITKQKYDELVQISRINFRFKENQEILKELTKVAKNMQYYPIHYAISGNIVKKQRANSW